MAGWGEPGARALRPRRSWPPTNPPQARPRNRRGGGGRVAAIPVAHTNNPTGARPCDPPALPPPPPQHVAAARTLVAVLLRSLPWCPVVDHQAVHRRTSPTTLTAGL